MDAVPAGTIGGTYCGNPLACAAALKTIELMERDDLAARSRQIGQIVTARCAQWQTKFQSQTNENKDWMALFTLVGFSVMMVMDVALG